MQFVKILLFLIVIIFGQSVAGMLLDDRENSEPAGQHKCSVELMGSSSAKDKYALFQRIFQNADSTREEKTAALKYLGEAAEAGLSEAQFELGVVILNGKWLANDLNRAIGWFMAAAEQDHAVAQMTVGGLLYEVAIDEHDSDTRTLLMENSVYWLQLAVKRNDLSADDHLLAKTYLGRSLTYLSPTDLNGWQILKSAACAGSPDAQVIVDSSMEVAEKLAKDADPDAARIYPLLKSSCSEEVVDSDVDSAAINE